MVKQRRPTRTSLLAAILAASVPLVAAGAQETTQSAAKPAQIDRNGVMILIRTSLVALDQANKTGNYTVLRDIGAPAFQSNTAARLAEIFAGLRKQNLDLSGVTVLDPQLAQLPMIEPTGIMHMSGFFPSVPSQVNFELAYAPVDGQWRLFGISVGVGSSGPAAPQSLAPVAKTDKTPPAKPVATLKPIAKP